MPHLAEDARPVARIPEGLHDRRYITIRVHEAHDAAVVSIAARGKDASARLTDGDVDMGVLKPHALGGKSIQVRREARDFAPETTDGVTVKVVRREQKDIQSFCLGRSGKGSPLPS